MITSRIGALVLASTAALMADQVTNWNLLATRAVADERELKIEGAKQHIADSLYTDAVKELQHALKSASKPARSAGTFFLPGICLSGSRPSVAGRRLP